MRRIDLTGERFGRLLVLGPVEVDLGGNSRWRCRCDCGKELVRRDCNLKRSKEPSCGCAVATIAAATHLTHGETTGGHRSREYTTWAGMLDRCTNPRAGIYAWYGGRGIKVCAQWQGPTGFARFLQDMGRRPSPEHSLERKNNDGDYEPGNCVWATRKEQHRNTRRTIRVLFDGVLTPLVSLVERFGVPRERVTARLRLGWSLERALTEPSRHARDL